VVGGGVGGGMRLFGILAWEDRDIISGLKPAAIALLHSKPELASMLRPSSRKIWRMATFGDA